MYKYYLLLIGQIIIYANTLGQSKPVYSKEVEDRIRKVETSLASWVQFKDSSLWTLADRMVYYRVPGVSIAVIKDYKIDWVRGYGLADSADQRKVTTTTRFQAASISKSLNALGVLRLVDKKQLDLNGDVNNYLRSWKFPSDSFTQQKKITLAHLLSHTAGLGVHGFMGYTYKDTIPTDNEILDGKRPSNSPAVRSFAEPGKKMEYSGGGTMITKKVIIDNTGMDYDKYMEKFVLKPLGMEHSSFTQPPSPKISSQLAAGYTMAGAMPGKFNIYPEQAPDGLWTTPEDLGHFIIEMQLSLQGKSNKILSKEMTTTMVTPFGNKSSALGVMTDNRGGIHYFRHGGSNVGYKCEYVASMDDGNGLVIMTNSDEYSIIPEIINSVAAVYQWKDFYKPKIKTVIYPDTNKLKEYVGKYKINNATVTFKQEDGNLYLSTNGNPFSRVYFESEDTFFIYSEPGTTVRFGRDQQGVVVTLIIRNGDEEMRAEKIN
ncbi:MULTISPECIES: serine hydrolase domain-containing protein [Niastella]|uniref:Serine hydrolase n=1 Tax=Niastella soli TaxID=2821487 RepID=A0ABS3Z0M4_9BACT|nr:serine hydrolase domain-containing protein [Niastella soli]MBO9203721.1 serine hydrolase [Niastella soli]